MDYSEILQTSGNETAKAEMIDDITEQFIDSLDKNNLPSPKKISSRLVNFMGDVIDMYNAGQPRNRKLAIPLTPLPSQIGKLILVLYPIALIVSKKSAGRKQGLLAIYQPDGDAKGTYSSDDAEIRNLIRGFDPQISPKDIRDIVQYLYDKSPVKLQCSNPDFIAVNNGIFNYKTKSLMGFSQEFVFLTKCPVDYVFGAKNPVIHNPDDGTDFDMESWMQDVCSTPELAETMWQIIGAVIRPSVDWDKYVLFYAENGNNGKGTLCTLMRNLCGENNYVNLALKDFSREFMLEPLLHVSAIITDENDVGGFLRESANLKAIITGDPIMINRKYEKPVSFRFRGFMVQCVNELPRAKDTSESFYRRQLFVPFNKCFTGKERKYIKHDYLNRPEVLQYVLWRVLHMDYYEINEPDECKALMAEYKEYNNPVLEFWSEFREQFRWKLLPFGFLYALYKAWHYRFNPSGTLLGRKNFVSDLRKVIADDPEWAATDKSPKNTGNDMDGAEPLILEYRLEDWGNFRALDPAQACQPMVVKPNYKGLYRVAAPTGGAGGDD